jgi:hypothetical protein
MHQQRWKSSTNQRDVGYKDSIQKSRDAIFTTENKHWYQVVLN